MLGTNYMLDLSDLTVSIRRGPKIINNISLKVKPGEILGLVGESGSGKTTAALSILGYSSKGTEITSGQLLIDGIAFELNETMRAIRGAIISYVPQDPAKALNPALKVRESIMDVMTTHCIDKVDPSEVQRYLKMAGLGNVENIGELYPHQLSGGQKQRVSLALALCCKPKVIILDEPTTGLDVSTQSKILAELKTICSVQNVAMVYVTHDLAVINEIADRVAVMYAGQIVEDGPTKDVMASPQHPYTKGLLNSIPDHKLPKTLKPLPGVVIPLKERGDTCLFAARCSLKSIECETYLPKAQYAAEGHMTRCLNYQKIGQLLPAAARLDVLSEWRDAPTVLEVEELRTEHKSRSRTYIAAERVSFTLNSGECMALIGESGSGKTTILRTLAGLHPMSSGEVRFSGQKLASLASSRSFEQRRKIQIVFQDPANALNPQHSIFDAIARPAMTLGGFKGSALSAKVHELLDAVRLPKHLAYCYPNELSGGERQRVAIARALAAGPDLLLCDEITSALDVSVQAAILNLLDELRDALGLAMIFVTHDLGVVATIANRVVVLEKGTIVDQGLTSAVLQNPTALYTKNLLASAPSISQGVDAA